MSLARDAHDLIEALGLQGVVIGGWSLGGLAAQAFVAIYPQRVTHAVLIGPGPPGLNVKNAEQLFYDTASRPVNTFDDEVVLFFEPRSTASREAAKRSHDRIAQRTGHGIFASPNRLCSVIPRSGPRNQIYPADAVLAALKSTTFQILHVGGDHDISFPIENWYTLNGQLPTVQLLTFPQAGHGPQHQHPVAVAEHIATFVRTTARVVDRPEHRRRRDADARSSLTAWTAGLRWALLLRLSRTGTGTVVALYLFCT